MTGFSSILPFAICLFSFMQDQGMREKARALLAPAYGWFAEGFDTLDLKQAKVLLDALAS